MGKILSAGERVGGRRRALGWSQAELAQRSGLPRATVSAVETGRVSPSVQGALALARALGVSVEELFGEEAAEAVPYPLAVAPPQGPVRCWQAEVGGKHRLYPAVAVATSDLPHDGVAEDGRYRGKPSARGTQTLVLAGCDPAAGVLAERYSAASGLRMLALQRGGQAALELLRQGLVHVALVHRANEAEPSANFDAVARTLGSGFALLRLTQWNSGVALRRGHSAEHPEQCARIESWAPRERGTAARDCLEQLLGKDLPEQPSLSTHRAVAEAVARGWAEAGVCVELAAREAELDFLAVRKEAVDLVYPVESSGDPRIAALVKLLTKPGLSDWIDDLAGYDSKTTGELSHT